jgi:hypothetical protein
MKKKYSQDLGPRTWVGIIHLPKHVIPERTRRREKVFIIPVVSKMFERVVLKRFILFIP